MGEEWRKQATGTRPGLAQVGDSPEGASGVLCFYSRERESGHRGGSWRLGLEGRWPGFSLAHPVQPQVVGVHLFTGGQEPTVLSWLLT